MDNYVVWGAGQRGKAVAEFIGLSKICAFIDSDKEKQGKIFLGKEIISYEDYKLFYSDVFIIVSMSRYKDVEKKLEEDEMYNFFLLSDCPQEVYGNGKKNILDDLPFLFDVSLPNVIWGVNLFSIIFFEKLLELGAKEIYIVSHPDMDRKQKELMKKIYKDQFKENIFFINGEANLYIAYSGDNEIHKKEYHVYNINDFAYQCKEYHNLQIEVLPKHSGKRCFIVATGPSLRIEDLDKLFYNHEICISMNKIFCSFDQTPWRPDYYLVQDKMVLEQNWQTIKRLQLKHILIADNFSEEFGPEVLRFHTGITNVIDDFPRFSKDASKVLYQGLTITYTCIQFAVYLGFKEIYLLGVDANYGVMGTKGNHFYKEEDLNNYVWAKEEDIKGYMVARKYAEQNNIMIRNATRGGMLEVFDRVDFDSLF